LSADGIRSRESSSQGAFDAARRRALLQELLADLSGRSNELLSFDQVRQRLHLRDPGSDVTLEEVPLSEIIGSVGRYRDFNRAFLPRAHVDRERWSTVLRLGGNLPPVDLFRVGGAYFVRDGNHRVSAARSLGKRSIQARIVDIPVRVRLDAKTSPDDLILKSGYAEFLEKTSLDQTCPEQNIELTRAGAYRALLQHIEVHQFYMGLRSRRFPTLGEAAVDWHQRVYLPLIHRIRESDILSDFPGRTESDLYLWIAENRARLQMRYGDGDDEDHVSEAVSSFSRDHRAPRPVRWIRRQLHRLFPRWYPRDPVQSR
jgi:uncharacterized ParB-like nuclease family protein